MEIQVSREAFLRALESTKSGLSPRDVIEQSTCFVLTGGQIITYNDEASCRGPSGLPKDFTGAVASQDLLELLRKMEEDDIWLTDEEGQFWVKGKRRRAWHNMEAEIRLPYTSVEIPDKFQELPEDFTEAVSLVKECTGKDASRFELTCVNLNPKWIEACQPPGTMVRTSVGEVPIEDIRVGQRVHSYSLQTGKTNRRIIGANTECRNQFKLGHEVTQIGQRPYKGELVVLTAGNKTTRYTTNHECVVKLDAAFQDKYIVYLLRRGQQFRVGVTGPRNWTGKWRNPRREGRSDVRIRMNTQRADACWVLACFDTEEEALMEERLITVRYGVPDMLFRVRPSEVPKWGKRQTQCDIFWDKFGDNPDGADACLRAYGRSMDYPFVEKDREKSGVRYPGSKPSHMGDVEIKVRACNLVEGMRVLDSDRCLGGFVTEACWVRFTLARESYDGMVHSMTVDHAHTYIGDGIVTHNCYDFQACRWKMKTGVQRPVLVKRQAIEAVTSLGVHEFSETDNWIHFRNARGFVLSCRRYAEDFPSDAISALLEEQGEPVTLPKGLEQAIEKANIYSQHTPDTNMIEVRISKGKLHVTGRGATGGYKETRTVTWKGADITFMIPPTLLNELIKKYNEVFLSEGTLRIDGGAYTYATSLTIPQEEMKSGRSKKEE